MTLGSWMKDYLYIPLGGSRVKTKRRMYFNLWFVFLVSGLWHGAAWNFVIWGAFHGFFLILDRLFFLKVSEKIGKYPSIIITFLVTMVGWVLFRAESWDQIVFYLNAMFSFGDFYLPEYGIKFWSMIIIGVGFGFITLSKWGLKLEQTLFFAQKYKTKGYWLMFVVFVILVSLSLSSITSSGFNPFIYFRF
jgi:alginate O-acetyltransferase complex protein AlgI